MDSLQEGPMVGDRILIGLTGAKYSGKDTLADHVCHSHGFIKYALADPLKGILGTDCIRQKVQDDFWVAQWQAWLNNTPHRRVVVSDVRFENEVRAIHDNGGVVLRIERPCLIRCDAHSSEQTHTLGGIDHTIINDRAPADMHRRFDALFPRIVSDVTHDEAAA
ncbi:g9130 [Coccomyxa viridis]|uniref:G9130 protein n=1 Tax=Coccomyxa viridis TaxID=1274662 RepID=A0ABP1G4I3_9CHLO